MSRVLVVDAEAAVRDLVAAALEDAGHHVRVAKDGETALLAARAEGFDLVLMDLDLPGLPGIDLLQSLRAEQPETEVLVLTSQGTVETAVKAMKLGAYDCLEKPLAGTDELELTVERALERRQLRSFRDSTELDRFEAVRLGYGSRAMESVEKTLRRVAATDATVVLLGESGTGKEVAARAVHQWSERSEGPFVAVNCAAITESLLESELFGHEKGAFTGAVSTRRGRIELAQGGTFFLDEVAELEPKLQAKLLRVLQEKSFERVGGSRTLRADVRWIAATHRDLETRMREGAFREDLYHRLMVFPVHLPALRERREDIVPLSEVLLRRIARELKRRPLRLTEEARERLRTAEWPGNVRELANVLERGAILAIGSELHADDLVLGAGDEAATESSAQTTEDDGPGPLTRERRAALSGTLEELEKRAIEHALSRVGGHRKKAAKRLGIGERTLYDKLRKYGIG